MKSLIKRIWNKNTVGRKIDKKGLFVQIDSPSLETPATNPYVLISGFCIAKSSDIDIADVTIVLDERQFRPHQIERRDVHKVFPDSHVLAFQKLIYFEANELSKKNITIEFKRPSGIHRENIEFQLDQSSIQQFTSDKEAKLNAIVPFLSHTFQKTKLHFNSLSAQEQANFEETGNISAHDYDQHALEIINSPKNKLILDAGAGLRNTYYPNVVNLEIVDYPTTDVIGTADALPFKVGVFDAVLSLNVLEHVRNPQKSAQELLRVLKPGGTLYVAVPFLQPFHGYPNHYYNMTINGLKNLFEFQSEIVQSGVLEAGEPIYALQWILSSYLNGLPAEARARFSKLTVSEILEILPQSDFVTKLADQSRTELSCVNFIQAVKHGA